MGWMIITNLFWLSLIMGILLVTGVLLTRWLLSRIEPITKSENALEILKRRYANGEISRQDFEQMKKDIE